MATREQRKASKKKAGRAERLAARRRDYALKRSAAAELADIRRNVHVEKGRAVTLNDIRPYARPKCPDCRRHPGLTKVVKDTAGKVIGAEPCRCAHKRFMKAHPEVIVEPGGAAFWPAEGSPYQVVAEAGVPLDQRETRPPEPGETDGPPPSPPDAA